MSLLHNIAAGVQGLFRKEHAERELDEELSSYVEAATTRKVQTGMSRSEAFRSARLELGSQEAVKENVRRANWETAIETVWQDVSFGARMLRKSPGFTVVAALTLALGIGANTAIFSVVNTVLLRPVSAPHADRIVVFMSTNPTGSSSLASEVKFNCWREQTSVLQDVSAYRPGSFNLTGIDQPRKAEGIFVTQNYLDLFGLPLAQGRSFAADEEQPDSRKVVVLSDTFWKSAFGGDSQILGKTIALNGDTYLVIGVLDGQAKMENIGVPNAPFLPEVVPDVWLPFPIDTNSTNQIHYFQTVGRLKPGITLEMANGQLQRATQEFRRKYPKGLSTDRGDVFSVQPLRDLLVRNVRSSLWMFAGAVSFVLLIACANVASLLLAKAASRSHEIAIRTALGASRGRIVRQLLAESMLLSVLSAALGLGLGTIGIHALLRFNPYSIPRIGANASNIIMDWRVLGYTVLVASITGILFGLGPTFRLSRHDFADGLKEGDMHMSTGPGSNTVLSYLVIGEIGLSLILLLAAGLLIRSLITLRAVKPGFDPHNVVIARTTLDPKLATASSVSQIIERGVERIEDLPGVDGAASTNLLPLEGTFAALPITVVGRPLNGSLAAGHGSSRFMTISPAYFKTLAIPIVRGRLFTDADGSDVPSVAIINQAMARKFWPEGDALNAEIYLGRGLGPNFDEPPRQIVGIVADVHDDALDQSPEPAVLVPIAQRLAAQTTTVDRTWVIRVHSRSPSLDAKIQSELRQAIGGLPVPPLRSMEEVTVRSTDRQDFNMRLLTFFGCAAIVMAAIGMYGMIAYSIRERTREIAIRVALGADRNTILRAVMSRGMRLALIGMAIGIAGALALKRLLSSFLYGVAPSDPVTFMAVILLLLSVALLACYIPARRATRADPMVTLRHE